MRPLKRIWTWLIEANSRVKSNEDSRSARLFSILMLIQFCLVISSLLSINYYYEVKIGRSIWHEPDTQVVLLGMIIIGVSYMMLRCGLFRSGIILYIVNAAAVALIAPFTPTPKAEMGLLASATIPVLLTAMIFSYRWVAAVLVGVLMTGVTLLVVSPLTPEQTAMGFAILIVVGITGTLVLILRYHLNSIEDERVSEIRKVAHKYRNLFETIADGIFIANENGFLVDVNKSACEQLGYNQEELIGKSILEISGRTSININNIFATIRVKGHLSYKTSHRRKDGTKFPVDLSLTMIEHQGELRLLGVAHDISEHEAEISFRESVLKYAAEGLCVCNEIDEYPFTRFTFWNDKMTEITGYSMEEINKLGWYQTVYPDPELRAKAIDRMAAMRHGNNLKSEEWTITGKDHQNHTLEISTSVLKLNDNNMHVLALMHDITPRKMAEEALTRSELKYRELLNSLMEGIGLVNKDEVITYANPAFARIFEFETVDEIVGKNLLDFVAPESMEAMRTETARRAEGICSQYELWIITSKGNKKCLYCSLTPRISEDGLYDGALGATLDITDKIKSENEQLEIRQKLERAERMESLGILAGGVAHDLNNMLSPIIGYAGLLLRELPDNPKISSKIGKMAKAAEDASTVIQDLLTLARRGRYEMQPLDMNQVIKYFMESAAFESLKERNPDIAIETNFMNTPAAMKGSEPHLAKAIMNLITNAFEAMKPGGTLIIGTERIHITKLYGGYQNINEGDYIVARFKDTGEGIDQSDIEKIFEPYFSKKKMGRSGSGLGLSVVYGIVKDHHGYYDVLSAIGQGTEFILYFPAEESNLILNESGRSKIDGGTETVLLVDDSPDQRELACEIIASLGYSVLAAENGHRAIDIISWQPVDIIVLDMIMEPNFDGLDTYREILKLRPEQKAIVVSGYSATERVHELRALGAGAYVRKPYSIDTLAKAIRDELDKKPEIINS